MSISFGNSTFNDLRINVSIDEFAHYSSKFIDIDGCSIRLSKHDSILCVKDSFFHECTSKTLSGAIHYEGNSAATIIRACGQKCSTSSKYEDPKYSHFCRLFSENNNSFFKASESTIVDCGNTITGWGQFQMYGTSHQNFDSINISNSKAYSDAATVNREALVSDVKFLNYHTNYADRSAITKLWRFSLF